MAQNEEVFQKIKKILIQMSTETEPRNIGIGRETLLLQDLLIDSLKVAELSILLEQEFNNPFFLPELFIDQDPYSLTVDSLVNFVVKEMGK